jgi:prolyl oligopeptidase
MRVLSFLLLLGLSAPFPQRVEAQGAQARRVDHFDEYFGQRVADPYRWMEQASSELTTWITDQDQQARRFAAASPERDRIHQIIASAARVERFSPVATVGERMFVIRADGSFSRRHLVALEADGRESIIIADSSLPPGRRLSGVAISPDGKLLAYGLTEGDGGLGGWAELRFRDLVSGRDLPDRLTGLYGVGGRSGLAWLPDATGLYYERYPVPAGNDRTARLGAEHLYFHRIGDPQSRDALVHDPGNADHAMTTRVTPDGRFLVVGVGVGGAVENRVLIGTAGAQRHPLRALVDSADAAYLFLGHSGDTIWFQTTARAPNGRIIGINVHQTARDRWIEVVPESSDAMEPTIGAAMVGDRFIVAYRRNAWLDVKVFETDGTKAYDLRLPKVASIWTGFVGRQDNPGALYTVSDFADPGTLYRLDVRTGENRVVRRPRTAYDPEDFVVRQVFYRAGDGTSIPMFLAQKRSLESRTDSDRQPRPLIIYGYGAFSWAASPWFRPDLVGWMESGGIFAMPNIRGGGEFGEAWHLAAVRTTKQVAVDDYVAAARWLVENKYTTNNLLVGNGGSASGAVVGAAMVQHPELFAAITLDYPALDMVRLDQFTGGRQWRSEFGSTEIEEEFEALLAYSPYHNLKPGTCYPATIVVPGELDQTTVPMHAYKFVAALQHAQQCKRPILLRVSWGAGHSAGATLDDSIDNWADQVAILRQVLGVGQMSGVSD